MKSKDTIELITALNNGEESALVHVIEKYNARLSGYALSLAHDRDKAQDIVQNVFLRLWENRFNLKISISLQSYLFRSVYNEFINDYRENRRTLRFEDKYYGALENIVTNYTEHTIDNLIAQMRIEINKLPPKCQKIFMMSKKEGLTNLEIADYLNISVKTVEAHIAKAFLTLRQNLKKNYSTLLFLCYGLFNLGAQNDYLKKVKN